MKRMGGRWIVVLLMILVDWYIFKAVRTISESYSERNRAFVYVVYWSVSAISIIYILFLPYFYNLSVLKNTRNYLFAIVVGIFVAKIIAALFLLIDDIRRLFMWIAIKLLPQPNVSAAKEDDISRSVFLSWLSISMGTAFLGTFIYGFTNKYNYRVKRIKLSVTDLPPSFEGFRILQLSDIHSGSLKDVRAVEKGIEMALQQQPDIIFVTGDLVNDEAVEILPLQHILSKLSAPYGVYSILGNHDYGDYKEWPTAAAKLQNVKDNIERQKLMGWKILLNENAVIKKEKDEIAVIGVENWSAKANFPKHGDLRKAVSGVEHIPFKILLSHDPSHWDGQVIKKYKDIQLTLAGHTHGMQFGVEVPGFKWSPVQYVYKRWAGLYRERNQLLYVNRGFGFIGYPGRVGILPEITVLTLTQKKHD